MLPAVTRAGLLPPSSGGQRACGVWSTGSMCTWWVRLPRPQDRKPPERRTVKTIHVVTVPPELDLPVLDRVLGGVESVLLDMGAQRVWVDAGGPALAVMAEVPDGLSRSTRRTKAQEAISC